MAGQDWTTPDAVALAHALQETPYTFGFFTALRHVECLFKANPRLGQSQRPADDVLRLGQEPSLAFAPSTLAAFQPATAQYPARLQVNFFGLMGPHGPLPLHLTEYARQRLRHANDPTFACFLDLFHHRMLSFYYRAWANAQPTVNLDRPEKDRFALYLGALCGLGQTALRQRDALPDAAKLYYAGRLSPHVRNAAGLQAVLSDFFRMPVVIEQFVGEWLRLAPEQRWYLGIINESGVLGVSAVTGATVWGCQHKFRLVFGPLTLRQYRYLLPRAEGLQRLVAWVRNYVGDELGWDVRLILKQEQVPALRLGGAEQLGWTTWLAGTPGVARLDRLVLDPMAYTQMSA